MSAALHLCDPDDLAALLPMVTDYHRESGIQQDAENRRRALTELLSGLPHGVAYLIGPRRAPVGYILLSFGFSLALGGLEARIAEFYIRPNIRGRGMGTEVLQAILPMLAQNGVVAMHLELPANAPRPEKLFARAGFQAIKDRQLMTRRF